MVSKQDVLLSALLGLCLSCASWSQRVPEDPRPLLQAAGAAGEGPSVQVVLSKGATEQQLHTCQEAVSRYGVASQPEAEVSALLDISAEETKTLTVTSKKKGQVLKQERPAWYLEDLCSDALAAAVRAWAAENGRTVPPPPAVEAPRPARSERASADEGEPRRPRRSRQGSAGRQASTADGTTAPASNQESKKGGQDPWGNL